MVFSEDQAVDPLFTEANGPFLHSYDVTGITPTTDGTLTVDIVADVDDALETVDVTVEGTFVGTLFTGGGGALCPGNNVDSVTIPLAVMTTAAADGSIDVTLTPSVDVGFGIGCIPTSGTVNLSFTGTA